MFGELTDNLTRGRNDQLLKKVRSLATVTWLCLPWSCGSIVCLLKDGRKVIIYSARSRAAKGHIYTFNPKISDIVFFSLDYSSLGCI